MIPTDQIVFDKGYGDCLRACIASIFEYPIEQIPNFWEHTDDTKEFWLLINNWLSDTLQHKCVVAKISDANREFIRGLLCVAIGLTATSDEEHAVVWRDGMIHDPHPRRSGLRNEPDLFAVFVPLDPLQGGNQ